jgi:membrane protease YdiL (CAAX protease family)
VHDRSGPHPVRLLAWLAIVLVMTSLNYVARLEGGELPEDLAYRWSSSIGAAIQFGVLFALVLLVGTGLPKAELLALRRPASWKRAAGATLVALLVVYAGAFAYTQALSLVGDLDPGEEQGLLPEEWDPTRVAPFVAFFLVVTILAPIVEELLYRGLGIALLAPVGPVAAVLVTGVLFGATHGLLVGLPILVFFGVVLGWLRLRTESLYPPIALHAAFNGIALIVSVTVA